MWPHGRGFVGATQRGMSVEEPGAWVLGFPEEQVFRSPVPPPPPTPPSQRVIRSRSQSMDAMGLSNKKPNTVSTSHSGSFAPNNPDLAKAAGIVSASLGAFSSPLPSPHPCGPAA